MATRTTDMSSSEEEIYYYTYYSSTECESDFEYAEYSKEELGKLGNYFFKLYFCRLSCIFFLRAYL